MPWNCRPKFMACSLCELASSGMATKNVVIGARSSCENAGAAINVAAAAAALTAICLLPMAPLLNQGEASVTVNVLRALSTGAARLWSGGTVAEWMRSKKIGVVVTNIGVRPQRIFELGLGNQRHVVREELFAPLPDALVLAACAGRANALLVHVFQFRGAAHGRSPRGASTPRLRQTKKDAPRPRS